MSRLSLPIDSHLPEILASLRRHPNLIIEAAPGAGKTTRVPPALLSEISGEVWVLEPRRLAARLAARRVAEELGEALGETVGYQVRFEEQVSERTRLRFVTEGILTRRLVRDPLLQGIGAVVLDEVHERHLLGDVALALLRRLQQRERPDLKLVAMSATLPQAPLAAFLGDAPLLRVEGRLFAVDVEYLSMPDERPLEAQVSSAVGRLLREGVLGDFLLFLPGVAEIRRSMRACEALSAKYDLLLAPLYGDLSPSEQDLAVRPATRRKVIFATNVAESSVTIDGVSVVIDSGLARVASHAPWSGLPTLRLSKISRASAIQRAGRAGRTGPGRCVRLYTKHDFETRPAQETAEILRLDLAETVLLLAACLKEGSIEELSWLEAPPKEALSLARRLLLRLGGLTEEGRLSALGERMLLFPLHPRQARILLEAEARGYAWEGCVLAALLGERDIFLPARSPAARGASDLLERLEAFEEAKRLGFDEGRMRALGLSPTAVMAVERARKQLWQIVRSSGSGREKRGGEREGRFSSFAPSLREEALQKSILLGYPDRVGRLRRPHTSTGRSGTEVVLSSGKDALVSEESVVHDAAFCVALDAEVRATPRGSVTVVRQASAIELDWLLEYFFDVIEDRSLVRVTPEGRVEGVRQLWYEDLLLEETPSSRVDPAEAAQALLAEAERRGLRQLLGEEEFDRLSARFALVRAHCPSISLPPLSGDSSKETLAALCEGAGNLAELTGESLLLRLLGSLSPEARQALEELAPERITLPGGRKVKVNYPIDAPPFVASRLQDFFGMAKGPSLAGGKIPLVLHLLAPNGRAVQITTDLEGFWQKHYPSLARELGRRYPRHSWPEDPLRASPPAPGGKKRGA